MELSCALRCADAVLLCVQAYVGLAFVKGDVVIEGVACPGNFFSLFCLFFNFLFDHLSLFLNRSDLFDCCVLFDHLGLFLSLCCLFDCCGLFLDDVVLLGSFFRNFCDHLFVILFFNCFVLNEFDLSCCLCYFFYYCCHLFFRDLICEYSCGHYLEYQYE